MDCAPNSCNGGGQKGWVGAPSPIRICRVNYLGTGLEFRGQKWVMPQIPLTVGNKRDGLVLTALSQCFEPWAKELFKHDVFCYEGDQASVLKNTAIEFTPLLSYVGLVFVCLLVTFSVAFFVSLSVFFSLSWSGCLSRSVCLSPSLPLPLVCPTLCLSLSLSKRDRDSVSATTVVSLCLVSLSVCLYTSVYLSVSPQVRRSEPCWSRCYQ